MGAGGSKPNKPDGVTTFHDLKAKDIDGNDIDFQALTGKVSRSPSWRPLLKCRFC